MAALSHAAEYAAVREAIQQLTTLDANGNRRDVISFSIDGVTVTYAANQLHFLQERETILAARRSARNVRKRTVCDFSSAPHRDYSVS